MFHNSNWTKIGTQLGDWKNENITEIDPENGFVITEILLPIENDAFLTPERIQKYEDMLDAADAITYATEEKFFYTAQENV